MRSTADICRLYNERREEMAPYLQTAMMVRDLYENAVDVPGIGPGEKEKIAVANLLAMGLDQTAMRISSVMPDLYCPPLRPGIKASEDKAMVRRKAMLGWWETNRLPIKMRRRARYLVGYATAPVMLRPDKDKGIATWQVRDPLGSFPCPTDDPDEITPPDCVFAFHRPYGWLRHAYPEQAALIAGIKAVRDTDHYNLLEYADDQEWVLLCTGRSDLGVSARADKAVVLERIPNLTGICPVVVPGRITLGRKAGQFDGMLGMYLQQARLMALEVIAVEKGIFPDLTLEANPGETPQVIGGEWKDGRTGQINVVTGGRVGQVRTDPGFQTNPTIDRLERAARLTSGIPAEFGGESPGNVRTGRRGEAVMSAVVDFPVQEAQEVLAHALVEENRRAVAIAKTYFGERPQSFYVNWRRAKGRVDYTPNKDFETDNNVVTYPVPGTDVNGMIITNGQRLGMGTLSKRGFMEMDPHVQDPEVEHDRVVAEALEQAFLSGLQQKASTGEIALTDLARVIELVRGDKTDLIGAFQQAQEEAQERQAQTPESPPVDPMSPAAQPGMDPGAEAAVIGEPNPSLGNLRSMLGNLRLAQASTPQERAAG